MVEKIIILPKKTPYLLPDKDALRATIMTDESLPDKDTLIKKITTDESIPEMRRICFTKKIKIISDLFEEDTRAYLYIPNKFVRDMLEKYYKALGYEVTFKGDYIVVQ